MRRTSIVVSVTAIVVLAGAAGCSGKAGQSSDSGLTDQSAPSASGAASPTGGQAADTSPSNPTTTKSPATTSDWPSPEDCISYNPATLTFASQNGVYTITDGSVKIMRLHGQSDEVGQQGVALAKRYRKHCFLGRTNARGDMTGDYIFDYWRSLSGQSTTIPNEADLCSPYNNHNLTVEDMGGGNGWRVKDHDHVLHLFDNQSDARNGALVLAKYSQVCQIGNPDDTDQDLGAVSYAK